MQIGQQNMQSTDENFTVVSTAALESLKRMVEELERDAARYRWLREKSWIQSEVEWRTSTNCDSLEDIDAAIDAAIKKE